MGAKDSRGECSIRDVESEACNDFALDVSNCKDSYDSDAELSFLPDRGDPYNFFGSKICEEQGRGNML